MARETSISQPGRAIFTVQTSPSALDARLADADVGQWPMCQFWPTPEAMILDPVTKHHQLRRAGASEDLIWQKLEDYRADHGTTEFPRPCTLPAFIQHRLAIEDREYLGLGAEFLEAQIARCEQFTVATREHEAKCSGWPPAEWLTERVSLDSILARPLRLIPESRAQAILQLRAYKIAAGNQDASGIDASRR
jgi:hypothetical protein